MPALPPREASVPLEILTEENFEDGIDGWYGAADTGALSSIDWSPDEKLLWTVRTEMQQAAFILHHWPDLSNADGLSIRLTSENRTAFLVMGIQESDDSVYSLALFLEKADDIEYNVPFEAFSLQVDSVDENDSLDTSQLDRFSIIDISSHIANPGPNTISIDNITLWTGNPNIADFFCSGPDLQSTSDGFMLGIDASFIKQGEQPDRWFWVEDNRIDPMELFAVNGADSFRLRLFVGDKGDFKLDYATKIALRAQEAGLQPYLVLFLSDDWSDVNKQPVPAVWADLTFEERIEAVREYSRDITRHFIEQGIELDFYEIGNEIDYGICGVFADTDHPRNPELLREDTWPDEARLIKAAIQGVREVDPDARFMLHIAVMWDPGFAVAFYRSMLDFGVDFDYCGLSYYPTAFGMLTASRLCETLDRLHDFGKPVIIAETAYPAVSPAGGPFEDWRHPVPGYPITPEGQAWWLYDFFRWMHDREDVLGVYVFSPDFWFSGEIFSAFALFDSEGRARPAIGSFQGIN
jgi:arabinogalactan endo-1,4-beta-galactosidase